MVKQKTSLLKYSSRTKVQHVRYDHKFRFSCSQDPKEKEDLENYYCQCPNLMILMCVCVRVTHHSV